MLVCQHLKKMKDGGYNAWSDGKISTLTSLGVNLSYVDISTNTHQMSVNKHLATVARKNSLIIGKELWQNDAQGGVVTDLQTI